MKILYSISFTKMELELTSNSKKNDQNDYWKLTRTLKMKNIRQPL